MQREERIPTGKLGGMAHPAAGRASVRHPPLHSVSKKNDYDFLVFDRVGFCGSAVLPGGGEGGGDCGAIMPLDFRIPT